MILAFSKVPGGFMCKNIETNDIVLVKKDNILNYSIAVDNLIIRDEKILGKGFNIEKMPEYSRSYGRCYIYKVKLTSDGQAVTGYEFITSKGDIQCTDKNNLVYFRKFGITNGNLVEDKLDIKNINDLIFEKAFKPVSYTSDEYYSIYKIYERDNLVTTSGRVYDNFENGCIKRNYVQPKYESFLESHKLINQILLKSKITKVVKIYNKMVIKNNCLIEEMRVEKDKKTPFYYKVTFSYTGKQFSILISPKDKKLINVINYKGGKLSKTKVYDIIDLVIDANEDKNEKFKSMITEVSDLKNKEINRELEERINKAKEIKLKKDKIEVDNKQFNIRKNILIGSADFSLVYNLVG